MAKISPAQKFKKVFALLEKKFGRRDRYGAYPPVQQALVTLLLKDGREDYALRTIRRLEHEFVDWNELRVCDPEMLDDFLGNGSPRGTGRLIRDTLTAIFNHSQSMNLDDVVELESEQAETLLKKLNSMPSRVAGELLLANLGYKKLPDGAGLLRVARRTKLVHQTAAENQIRALRRMVPDALLPRVFHAFETLAERICLREESPCSACPIANLCPTGVDKLARLRIEAEKERAAREALEKQERNKRKHAHKLQARKRASTKKLKQAIAVRKLKILGAPKSKRPARRPAGPARMVQASSAEVRLSRHKAKRRKLRGRRRPHAAKTRA